MDNRALWRDPVWLRVADPGRGHAQGQWACRTVASTHRRHRGNLFSRTFQTRPWVERPPGASAEGEWDARGLLSGPAVAHVALTVASLCHQPVQAQARQLLPPAAVALVPGEVPQ